MNESFQKFLAQQVAAKNKKPVIRLKVNSNNAIRSGSSLPPLPQPHRLAAPTPCERQKAAIEALKNIFNEFRCAASSTYA